jgi:hypothetical protein
VVLARTSRHATRITVDIEGSITIVVIKLPIDEESVESPRDGPLRVTRWHRRGSRSSPTHSAHDPHAGRPLKRPLNTAFTQASTRYASCSPEDADSLSAGVRTDIP